MKKHFTKRNFAAVAQMVALGALVFLSVHVSQAFAATLSRGVDVNGTLSAVWSMIGPFCAIIARPQANSAISSTRSKSMTAKASNVRLTAAAASSSASPRTGARHSGARNARNDWKGRFTRRPTSGCCFAAERRGRTSCQPLVCDWPGSPVNAPRYLANFALIVARPAS